MPFLRFYVNRLIQIDPLNNHYKLGQCESCEKIYLYKNKRKSSNTEKKLKAVLTVVNKCLILNSVNPSMTAVVFVSYGTMHIFLPGTIWLSVQVNKLVGNNVSKDRSFLQYLVWDILTNPDRVTLAKTGNKANFALLTYYSLKIKFVPFLTSQPTTIPGKRKAIKQATIKEEKEGEKRAREKDRKRLAKRVHILALRMHEKQKKRFHFFRLVEKYAFFLAKLVFRNSYANQPKTSPKKRNW